MKPLLASLCLAVGACSVAVPMDYPPEVDGTPSKTLNAVKLQGAQARFERLKSLAGSWAAVGTSTLPNPDPQLVYRVTAGGSAVLETSFPGSEQEMVTLYHLDGDELMLTHYCAAGNQPTMRAKPGPLDRIEWEFAGATHLASIEDGHMHDGVVEIFDEDHFTGTWCYWEGGLETENVVFEMERIAPDSDD